MEHGFDQGEAARQLLRDAGFGEVFTERDLGGNERCSGGRWAGGDADVDTAGTGSKA